jgi:hypothetical protein
MQCIERRRTTTSTTTTTHDDCEVGGTTIRTTRAASRHHVILHLHCQHRWNRIEVLAVMKMAMTVADDQYQVLSYGADSNLQRTN